MTCTIPEQKSGKQSFLKRINSRIRLDIFSTELCFQLELIDSSGILWQGHTSDMTLPPRNVSLAEWLNSGKENGCDEVNEGAVHAGVQARGGADGQGRPELGSRVEGARDQWPDTDDGEVAELRIQPLSSRYRALAPKPANYVQLSITLSACKIISRCALHCSSRSTVNASAVFAWVLSIFSKVARAIARSIVSTRRSPSLIWRLACVR